ncbi:MAG: hypothetical protein ACE3JP_04640 [Ectobacillus sp.]
MEPNTLHKDGVKKLINLSTEISELYRELHDTIEFLKECNSESVLFDSFYLQDFVFKREGLVQAYEQLLVQVCINSCFDMKSWKVGNYSYDRDEVMGRVADFNLLYNANVRVEDVLKSLHFDQGMEMALSRVE